MHWITLTIIFMYIAEKKPKPSLKVIYTKTIFATYNDDIQTCC